MPTRCSRMRAIADNRRLWLDGHRPDARSENALPEELRAAIISVGLAVQREMDRPTTGLRLPDLHQRELRGQACQPTAEPTDVASAQKEPAVHTLNATARPDALLPACRDADRRRTDRCRTRAARGGPADVRRDCPVGRNSPRGCRCGMASSIRPRRRSTQPSKTPRPIPACASCRAELRRRARTTSTGAAADAAEAVMHDPADPVAKALLGVLLLELAPRR